MAFLLLHNYTDFIIFQIPKLNQPQKQIVFELGHETSPLLVQYQIPQ